MECIHTYKYTENKHTHKIQKVGIQQDTKHYRIQAVLTLAEK